MKNFTLALFTIAILASVGCSRSDQTDTSVKPQSTPDVERLKSDSERLQQATANAAKQREKEAQSGISPTPSVTP